jgi:inner membrane protein
VRAGLTEGARVLGTAAAALLDPDRPAPPLDALPPESVQMQDARRFRHFSDDWMGVHPHDPLVIGDLRYATRPDLISPLWGIALDPSKPDGHVKLAYFRRADDASWGELWRMITGTR